MEPVTENGGTMPAAMKRKPAPETPGAMDMGPAPVQSHRTRSSMIPSVFLAGVVLSTLFLSWPLRWVISGAPILVYIILLGQSYGSRILAFAPLWTIFTTINLTYAVASTSWLLYWIFWACCWPTTFITCLFQFSAPARLMRRAMRNAILRDLHFIHDQIAFFDLPALEIDTETKGLFVIRGISLSLSTLTLVAHGIETGIKISHDIELGIQVDKVTVPLLREIVVGDVYANVKGGNWGTTFGDVPFGEPDPTDDPSVVVTDTAILRAASIKRKDSTNGSGRRPDMVRVMTAGEMPMQARDAVSAMSNIKKLTLTDKDAQAKFEQLVRHIHETSAITQAKQTLKNAVQSLGVDEADEDSNSKNGRLDLEDKEQFRAAVCTAIHNGPSIPHPPSKSIRVSTLRKNNNPKWNKFLHQLPFLYRLLLFPICYFHPVRFKSITAAGSGQWFVALMRQYLFKHYSSCDAEIRRLEARISAWCGDADFAVEFGEIESSASFPLNTHYNIKCNFKVSDIMAYRALPNTVQLKQVVRLAGGDGVLTLPVFLFPHHEHIFPPKATDFEIMQMKDAINDAKGTPKAVALLKDLRKLENDEAAMHISAHAQLPMHIHQDLLNFTAAIVKATKVIESDKDFEEKQVLRELKRIGTNATDSDVNSIASAQTALTDASTSTSGTAMMMPDEHGFKTFLKKVDNGFKEAGNKTLVGMRKAGHSTVSVIANDRWIARLVGKVTRKLEKAQGELGYSGEVMVQLGDLRGRHEYEAKILP